MFSMEDMNEHIKFTGAFAKTEFAKNMFFADKKKKDKIYMVISANSTGNFD